MQRPTLAQLNAQERNIRVFVYGTLKQGFHNWSRLLTSAKQMGMALVEGTMFHCGYYPAVSLEEKLMRIQGEIYDISQSEFQSLDTLEGYPHHYNREQIEISLFGKCWIYTYPHEKAVIEQFVVPSGNWKGPDTGKVRWLGFGKGILIGDPNRPTELVPINDARFILRPVENASGEILLVERETGQVIGKYKHLSAYLAEKGGLGIEKPRVRIPSVSIPNVVHQGPPPEEKTTVLSLPDLRSETKKPKEPLVGPGVREA